VNPDKSLAEILEHRARIGEPIPVPIALSILHQVCGMLDWAHNFRDPAGRPLGIVHRDVTPANIFIADAGLVRLVASTAPSSTLAYMAPEYLMTGMLDARADLFALGVVAHEMLANRPLFASRDDRETVERVRALPIPPPSAFNPHVVPELDSIVLMALARDPAARWQHAAMMRDALEAVARRLGVDLAPTPLDVWGGLVAARVEPAPAVPPNDPALWDDDDNLATRIKMVDPALVEAAPAPDQVPVRFAPPPVALPAPITPIAPAPEPPPAPPIHADFGPDPTQIGAMPLISFGNTPLVALIGENAQRAPAPSLPSLASPGATFLPEPTQIRRHHRNKRIAILAIPAILVTLAVVVLVVLAAR